MVILPIENTEREACIICAVVFTVLPVTSVIMRVLARRRANKKLDTSDYLIIAACVVVVFYQGVFVSSILVSGLGIHLDELENRFGVNNSDTSIRKHAVAFQILWTVSLGLCKVSILLFYCGIFLVQKFINMAKITSILIFIWVLTSIIGCFVICRPFAFFYDTSIPGGSCGNITIAWILTGSFNIITDFIALLLPMPYLLTLELALYKRLALVGVFGLGFATCIISIVRVILLNTIDYSDLAYSSVDTALFSVLEPCVGITLACFPILRSLFGKMEPKTSTKTYGSRSQGSSHQFQELESVIPETKFRPEDIEYKAHIATKNSHYTNGTKDGEDNEDGEGIKMRSITVKHEWGINEETPKNTSDVSLVSDGSLNPRISVEKNTD